MSAKSCSCHHHSASDRAALKLISCVFSMSASDGVHRFITYLNGVYVPSRRLKLVLVSKTERGVLSRVHCSGVWLDYYLLGNGAGTYS